jgi:hypothetical protein
MPRNRRILPLGALVALIGLAAPAAATAAPSRAAKGKTAKTVVLNVVRVDLRGDVTANLHDAHDSFRYEGSARYETSDDRGGTLRIATRPPVTSLVIKGLEYNGVSEVTLRNETDDTWRCGIVTPDSIAPTSLSALVAFTKRTARFGWILMNPPYKCAPNSGAPDWWTIPPLPTGTYSEYPLAKLRGLRKGKTLRMPIRLGEDAVEENGTYVDHLWRGYVVFERVR